jgi:molybdopterin/thiamine biosynthesis adenylyltransferase
MSALSPEETERYSRQLLVDGLTAEHQEKLRQAKVLVIGAGGLGSPVLLYLAGAGVGTLGIVEYDRVERSNLNRQILYTNNDTGSSKAALLKQKLTGLNPECRIESYNERWSAKNAEKIASGYHILVDCTDFHENRYLTDRISRMLNIPMVYGAVFEMEGQVAVFNFNGSRSYRDLFPEKLVQHERRPLGILGPVAGVTGSLQAAEVIKIVTGLGEVMVNRLMSFSVKYNQYRVMEF